MYILLRYFESLFSCTDNFELSIQYANCVYDTQIVKLAKKKRSSDLYIFNSYFDCFLYKYVAVSKRNLCLRKSMLCCIKFKLLIKLPVENYFF